MKNYSDLLKVMLVLLLPPCCLADPSLIPCSSPIKNHNCILQCSDLNVSLPVTFEHPIGNLQGACAESGDNCSSSNYTIYQIFSMTYLNISSLDKSRDEGEWRCSHGSSSSKIITLYVSSKSSDTEHSEDLVIGLSVGVPVGIIIIAIISIIVIIICYRCKKKGTVAHKEIFDTNQTSSPSSQTTKTSGNVIKRNTETCLTLATPTIPRPGQLPPIEKTTKPKNKNKKQKPDKAGDVHNNTENITWKQDDTTSTMSQHQHKTKKKSQEKLRILTPYHNDDIHVAESTHDKQQTLGIFNNNIEQENIRIRYVKHMEVAAVNIANYTMLYYGEHEFAAITIDNEK